MVYLISGTDLSDKIKNEISQKVSTCVRPPCLAVIIVGEDVASQVYVKNKEKSCKKCGIKSLKFEMTIDTQEHEILELIEKLNKDNNIDGILCQLPLPSHIDEKKVINLINPQKDVDCFNPINVGNLYIGNFNENSMLPCTPKGCVKLIKEVEPNLKGKKVCIVGRSNIVGKPMSQLMLNENCTVKIVHSKTENIEDETKWADILIVAIGKGNFIKSNMIKNDAIIIDVGVNRFKNGLCGDVDFDDIKSKAKAITPVPGGVGPMTIACLMENVYNAYCNLK
jgi:methylenetetrahydrofolate dehydrogenase (NADP+)/methenyltetrahydrofolate cyclohydrolase